MQCSRDIRLFPFARRALQSLTSPEERPHEPEHALGKVSRPAHRLYHTVFFDFCAPYGSEEADVACLYDVYLTTVKRHQRSGLAA